MHLSKQQCEGLDEMLVDIGLTTGEHPVPWGFADTAPVNSRVLDDVIGTPVLPSNRSLHEEQLLSMCIRNAQVEDRIHSKGLKPEVRRPHMLNPLTGTGQVVPVFNIGDIDPSEREY